MLLWIENEDAQEIRNNLREIAWHILSICNTNEQTDFLNELADRLEEQHVTVDRK